MVKAPSVIQSQKYFKTDLCCRLFCRGTCAAEVKRRQRQTAGAYAALGLSIAAYRSRWN